MLESHQQARDWNEVGGSPVKAGLGPEPQLS